MRRAPAPATLLCALLAFAPSPAAAGAAEEPPALRPLSGPRGDVAALILAGGDSGSLRVAALALAECAAAAPADRASARFWVEVEAASLLDAVASREESEVPESVRVELYAYAMTRRGEVAASLAQWVRLSLAELSERLPGGGAKLTARFELPPGEYQLRLLVREPRSQAFALRVLGLEVPAPLPQGPFLGPPRFADPGSWLLVGPAADAEPSSTRDLPAALPVVAAGSAHPFALTACGLAEATLEGWLEEGGRRVDGAQIDFETPAEGGAIAGRLRLPAGAAGLYRLVVSTGGAAVGVPVFAVAAEASDPGVAWTALGARAEPAARREADAALEVPDGAGSGRRTQGIAAAYRGVLATLAGGRREDAVRRLAELESAALGDGERSQRALKQLSEAQDRVARQLLDHDAESLLPVLLLHLDLQDRHLQAGGVSSHLVHANRGRIRDLAQVYALKAKSEMAPTLAAMSLLEMAQTLSRAQHRVSALIVLREALALDPSNPDALLELAYHYESHGFYDQAATALQRLLELEPRSDEGRLRQAMQAARAGRADEAALLLERLLRDATTEWVLAVAYEELGRHHLERGRTGEAVRLLREGVGRLPRVQRLHLELAYALDRSGERRAARAVVDALPPDDGRPSPRLVYRVAPDDGSRRSRAALVRHGTARLPLLAGALAASEAAP